jgi:osmotically-inducible protein OsmY
MRWFSILFLLLALVLPTFSASSDVDDDTLYDQVRIRIANDRDTGGNKIDVHVADGKVELTGKVKTERQKIRAEKLTRKVKGVRNVVNKIEVAPV